MPQPLRARLLALCALALCLCGNLCAQVGYDDEMCLDKTQKQLNTEIRNRKIVAGLNKTLIYLSYLSYSDRTVDRVVTGKDGFMPYEGRLIRNINIQILAPYGVSIEEPENDNPTKLQKFANSIQVHTKDWVVRNDLLFKQGEKVIALTFADTERNLWARGTFKDLKIFIVPVECSDELVDVVVMVQERGSWNAATSLAYDKVSVGLQFKNFMGLPHTLNNYVSFNYRKDNFYTIYGDYTYENIKRSQINFGAEYAYSKMAQSGSLGVSRNFFSANTKWAGHIKGGVDRTLEAIPNSFGQGIPTNTFTNWQDVWLATAFKFPGKFGKRYPQQRIILSGRAYRNQYIWRPYKRSPDGSQVFLDNTYFLGSIGFANWDYYVDHSVYYLGEAEYFAKGLSGALIGGFDYDEELQIRFYNGVKLSYGAYLGKAGYWNVNANYGGFVKRDSYQQVHFALKNQFFSSPIKLGNRFMMRLYIAANITLGFNRPLGKEIIVNNSNGVRGIFVDYVRGNRSYVFNFETDVFPTFKILNFSSSAFAFADVAISQKGSMTDNQITQGYGAGIRLRNLGMGIGFFEITFAYYPQLNIPNMKPYAFLGGFNNARAIRQDNLFLPSILNTGY